MQTQVATAYIGVTNKLYPIFEFWHDGKPYFYTGACSVNKLKDCYVKYADLTLGIEVVQYGTADWHNIEINGRKVEMNDWPEVYIDKLPKFTFSTKQQAKLWGVKFGEPLRMVKQYADKTALFRFGKGFYRTLSTEKLVPFPTVQTEAATEAEEQEEERLNVYLLPEDWKVAEKALCTSDIVAGQKAKIFEHLHTEYVVCSAMSNGKNEGWKDLAGYIIVPLSEYNGDLEPLKYGPHFSEVNKGTRKRSYVGMLIDTKNGKYVCTHGVEFFKSKSDPPTPEQKVKAKPKAATPKRLIQFEFIWNDGFCENPLTVAIAKAGKWNFNAFVASDKKGWYESPQFEAPGWYSKMVLSDLDPHPTKEAALLKIGNTALEMAIENKAPAGLIKQIREFISKYSAVESINEIAQDIEVNGIYTKLESALVASVGEGKFTWKGMVCQNPAVLTLFEQDEILVQVLFANRAGKLFFGYKVNHPVLDGIPSFSCVYSGEGAGHNTFPQMIIAAMEEIVLEHPFLSSSDAVFDKLNEYNFEAKAMAERSEQSWKELQQPEPIKTELVDGHQQIVLFDVPATEKKADPNAALFGYIAKNRTERQAFKRKLQRTTDWLDGLPADQRAAILKAIAAYTPPQAVESNK